MAHGHNKEKETTIYHVSGWSLLQNVRVGYTFTLIPGAQCAEGKGVYFSESAPRPSAAEGAANCDNPVTISIVVTDPKGWWRTKGSIVRKFNRPRTWHSNNKAVRCVVVQKQDHLLLCEWSFTEVA